MNVLNLIQEKLKALAASEDVPMEGVWYGACRSDELKHWNYFVFNRKKTSKSSNRCDYQTFYEIHVIHEDYIPEGYIEQVIQTLESQSESIKLKCTADDVDYCYTFKGNTNLVVEIATFTVFRPEKRC